MISPLGVVLGLRLGWLWKPSTQFLLEGAVPIVLAIARMLAIADG
jgi:hypothetical protein